MCSRNDMVKGSALPAARTSRGGLWAAGLIYACATALFFSPCLKGLGTFLIGPPEDNMRNLWDLWWAHSVFLGHAGSLSFTRYLFFPEGSTLLYHSLSFYNLFISLCSSFLHNPVLVYNLLILHTFVLAGLGAYCLIRHLTGDHLASLCGGFVFAFNPSHVERALHHYEIASIQFIPLFVLFFLKAMKEPWGKSTALAALFFLLSASSTWYYFIFTIYCMLFFYAYAAWKERRFILTGVIVKCAVIIGVTLVVFSPWLIQMVALGVRSAREVVKPGHDFFVADLCAFFVPHPAHALGQIKEIAAIFQTFTSNDWEKTAYLGIVNILLIAVAFKGIVRKTRLYFAGLVCFLILAMGAGVHVMGKRLPIPLPYAILAHIPFLSNARCPSRAIVFAYLFLAILVAYSLAYVRSRAPSAQRRRLLTLVIIALVGADYASLCKEQTKVYLPACYAAIKKEEVPFGILDMPSGGWENSARYMMYQTYHGFPIVGGALARKPAPSLIDFLVLDNLALQKEQLKANQVRYIVVHKELYGTVEPQDLWVYRQVYTSVYADPESEVLKVY